MVIISTVYPDLTCKFPNEMDPNRNFSDVTIDAIPLVKEYYQYFDSGDFINATKILNDNPTLKNMIINAAAVQYLYDMCIASQRFYLNDVQRYLVEIVKYKDEWSNTAKYTKYNVVTYIQNGGRESFIAIRNDIPIGTVPTNMDCFVPLTMRGERGVSGVGLSPRGLWSIEANYYVDDLVVYKNRWYYAKRNNSQSIPKLVSDDWEMILEVTQQIKTSETQPTDQSFGDVWMQKLSSSTTGECNIALNQVNVDGNYVYLYPKTRAGLVNLVNGTSVETAITNINNRDTAIETEITNINNRNTAHTNNKSNPHTVTSTQIGLGSVNNTADSAKNALSATKLTTARTINGVAFNGSANITVTAAASGGNSNTVGGLAVGSTANTGANQLVRTDGSGYLNTGWISTTSGTSTTPNRIYCSNDNYLRYCTPAQLQDYISSNGSGSWGLKRVAASTGAPSGGKDGDIWLQYK